jgi:hypothetical protein
MLRIHQRVFCSNIAAHACTDKARAATSPTRSISTNTLYQPRKHLRKQECTHCTYTKPKQESEVKDAHDTTRLRDR